MIKNVSLPELPELPELSRAFHRAHKLEYKKTRPVNIRQISAVRLRKRLAISPISHTLRCPDDAHLFLLYVSSWMQPGKFAEASQEVVLQKTKQQGKCWKKIHKISPPSSYRQNFLHNFSQFPKKRKNHMHPNTWVTKSSPTQVLRGGVSKASGSLYGLNAFITIET